VWPVELPRANAPRGTQASPERGIDHEALERGAERVDIPRLDEEPRDVSLNDLLVAVDVACDDRDSRGHRLEQHDAERLLARRWRAEDVRGLVEPCLVDLAHASGEQDVLYLLLVHERP